MSLVRATPATPATSGSSVIYALTFNEVVTGVTPSDFRVVTTGNTSASSTITVSPSSGYNSVYAITVNSVSGTGTLGLNLINSYGIVDQAGDSGTFQAQQTVAAGNSPYGVATADLNGDGHQDVVVSNYGSNTVSVFLGKGDGTFYPQVTYAVGTNPQGIAIADLNRDGFPDLIVTNGSSGNVGVLLGNGDGTFQPQKTYSTG